VKRLDDPALVAEEYSDETRLRRRASIYGADDAKAVALRAVSEATPGAVLEVGCGLGDFTALVAAETGATVVAVDISPRMVELARSRGVDARLGDVQELPFADACFDVAIAGWMLYHVPDLPRAIGELARVLRPGGRLVAMTNSVRHLIELRELVGTGPAPLSFSRESGNELLRGRFAAVERIDVDGTVEFADRAAVEEYVRASIVMSPFVQELPASIEEPFTARRSTTVFVATR
jgi:SAM-dependent methyltransferase